MPEVSEKVCSEKLDSAIKLLVVVLSSKDEEMRNAVRRSLSTVCCGTSDGFCCSNQGAVLVD